MAYAFHDDKSKVDIFPVGSIYLSVADVNPSAYFGGTWERWGAGRVPVGVDANNSDFATVEKTGGTATHAHGNPNTGSTTLTVEQIPSHKHGYHTNYASSGVTIKSASSGSTSASNLDPTPKAAAINTDATGGGKGHTHTMGDTDNASTLQPYITCYMWKRTA